jgi:hypothetical protein
MINKLRKGVSISSLVLVMLISSVCYSEPRYYGIANLGLAKYADTAVKGHTKGFANVTFTNTFGDAYDAIDKLLSTGKVPFQEYNLLWKDNHNFTKKDFPFIVKEAQKYSKLADKYPNVECAFSGATEHTLSKKDATDLAKQVLAVIPSRCVYVNNPWEGKGAFIDPSPRIWNEVHGSEAHVPKVGGKYIWNADGSDVFDFNIEVLKKRFVNAEAFVFWTSQNNGRKNRNDPTPRPQRKAWPTVELLEMEAFLATPQGAVKLPNSKYTVKPKADQHEVPPEPRALKPVFVFPINAERLELRDDSGKVVITSEKAQPFADGRMRYYFGDYGYKIVQKAKQAVLNVFAKGAKKRIGRVNPGFRQ